MGNNTVGLSRRIITFSLETFFSAKNGILIIHRGMPIDSFATNENSHRKGGGLEGRPTIKQDRKLIRADRSDSSDESVSTHSFPEDATQINSSCTGV